MSIIEVKNLGKKYNIGEHQGYVALRDVLANIVKASAKWFGGKVKSALSQVDASEFWALKDVNFTVEKGEVLGIIGRNGAGKSTLLKILSQITPPTTGEIKLRGRVGSLLEVGTGFHQELTGRENIYINGAILGMRKKEMEQKFDQIVEFAGIGKFLDTPVKRYSSGMQVRLAFSVAAHLEPEILIVDEVLAVGDLDFQKKCLGKMEEVTKKEGRTVLFVSHNMSAIRSLCNRCLLLEKGELKLIGETNQVITAYSASSTLDSQVKIKKENHVQGNGDAVITEVSMEGYLGNKGGTYAINELIKIIINYEVKKDDKKISFFVLFYDENGQPLLSSFQKDSANETVESIAGKHKIQVEFEDLGLLPGRYNLSLGIITHEGSYICWEYADLVDGFLSFDISRDFFQTGKRFESRPGLVEKKAKWIFDK